MTSRAFHVFAKIDEAALRRAVAGHFGVEPRRVCIYRNAHDIDEPRGKTSPGPLWCEHEAALVSVYLEEDGADGPLSGWFAVEPAQAQARDFEDRPLAHAVAAALNASVVFRDPTPDPHDSPYVEAAQVQVDPDGRETPMWLVENGDGAGGAYVRLLRRDEI